MPGWLVRCRGHGYAAVIVVVAVIVVGYGRAEGGGRAYKGAVRQGGDRMRRLSGEMLQFRMLWRSGVLSCGRVGLHRFGVLWEGATCSEGLSG